MYVQGWHRTIINSLCLLCLHLFIYYLCFILAYLSFVFDFIFIANQPTPLNTFAHLFKCINLKILKRSNSPLLLGSISGQHLINYPQIKHDTSSGGGTDPFHPLSPPSSVRAHANCQYSPLTQFCRLPIARPWCPRHNSPPNRGRQKSPQISRLNITLFI